MSTYLLASNNNYLTLLAKQLGVVIIYINILSNNKMTNKTSKHIYSKSKFLYKVCESYFYSYYIHQGNRSDKERKILRKKLSFMYIYKKI